ncbi:MAG: hypothetical protein LC770_11890 [Acidobacteria bacterium]|nr:hypothetical protein [Acidobacteriota bacterium]
MNNEEIQKKMDFIIEQQAQFAADIQRSKEIQEAEAKLWREKYNGRTLHQRTSQRTDTER